MRYRRATQGLSCDAPYIPMRSLGHVNRRHHEETCVSHTGDFSGSGDARGALRLRCSQCPVDGGTIHGGGTANMTDLVAAGFKGVSSFGFEATLFSDGSARGHFDCVDHMGDLPGYPGNVFGDITRWSSNADGTLTLFVTNGSLVGTHGGFVAHGGLAFAVTIQHFGGAGVGHWTLDFPGVVSPFNGGPICQELLTSGQIVVRWN